MKGIIHYPDERRFYGKRAREKYIEWYQGKRELSEVPIPLLPKIVIDNMTKELLIPNFCEACNLIEEPEFPRIGEKHCVRCNTLTGYTPISLLPSVDIIKSKIWQIINQDISRIEMFLPVEGWRGYWNLYITMRYENGMRAATGEDK